MSRLAKLVRLRKSELDEARRVVSTVEAQRAEIERSIQQLDDDLAAEAALAGQTVETAAAYARFADATRARQEAGRQSIARLDEELDAHRAVVAAAFSEWKRIELLEQQRLQEAQVERARQEQAAMDEIAQQRAARG